jgi:predicted Holliday junction resolvase-like endonuclease
MFSPRDCRALFEPIDYLIFPGLAARRRVDCVIFADVKSGKARLKSMQRDIHRIVDTGRVFFKTIRNGRTPHEKPAFGI